MPGAPWSPRSTGLVASCFLGLLFWWGPATHAQTLQADSLAVAFGLGRGQVEVGGVYAGAEFHDSRPVPARISFYAPVANSLDLSTDYWTRGDSRPLTLVVRVDGRADSLGATPWAYRWTPYAVTFHERTADYDSRLAYRFADDLPGVVMQLMLVNRTGRRASFEVDARLTTTLRTSHTYATRAPHRTAFVDDGATFLASFDAADTDSVALFVANVGATPDATGRPADATAAFTYAAYLAPGDSLVVTQIIGTSRQRESAAVRRRAVATWADAVEATEDGIRRYVRDQGRFDGLDPALRETDRLARALLRADRHHLDGQVVPMPSPAEYNFFFTHDLLLTDLGAVHFDPARVRDDLRYVQSLVRADSVLPHARYWKDSTYVVESANADNWNHLWAVILSASYLKHSGDTETVDALYPTLQKSLALMLGNERDGLMVAERPDWWDIGHVPGPRAYLTALTIRALDAYAYLTLELGRADAALADHARRAAQMRRALVDDLWDDEAGYLLNGLDATRTDRHYYTGSLVAAWFDLLDPDRRDTLLDTARRELLDEHVGMRNAMPMDYHLLTDVYRFQEGEVGTPGRYMNGGVWPQGNAWYALGLIAAGRVDEARDALTRYLSVAGVEDSPNGQPAFYEYRNADSTSAAYGAVDKPTFLWAGGWFLHVLYHLAGVRETPWTVSFSPLLPEGFEAVAYDLAVEGGTARVSWSGTGTAFRRIVVNGAETASAVLTGPASRIELVRGVPEAPYLASATALVDDVSRSADGLVVQIRGVVGQEVALEIVSPRALSTVRVDGRAVPPASVTTTTMGETTTVRLAWTLERAEATVTITP
ncbi:MGH1-like glycoside hydrolase domain-containing protein [Rubrivirga marina]|uniref:Mannosylglycerate hydrolase MGH1-like glycoside hydrolase domain-containing protein n=1 Tax=Rubrivirga marina TaxID=1196024 RepID=A0A271IX36_9BACT|nr:hypothetical protein [Rubrivirga marina]PAP75384.1 hypothetical protein BSZ37_02450 [Rubrivirga marina]